MKTYQSGQSVRGGVYVAPRRFDLRVVGADDEPLEGKKDAKYLRIPTLLLIALGPVIGGAYVVAFPFVIMIALAVVLVGGVRRMLSSAAENQAHLAQVRWQPGAAYLNGSENAGKASEGEPPDDELDDLEKEIRARREEEE